MRYRVLIFLGILGLAPQAFAAQGLDGCKQHVKYGAPSSNPVMLCRVGYALSYNSEYRVPDWVAYHLTHGKVHATLPVSDDYRADLDLEPDVRAELQHYQNSGYDLGQMAPSAVMRWDKLAMSESLLLSNVAPQVGIGFKRHIWSDLEAKVREWTLNRGELYVVTGPIVETGSPKYLGNNAITVPTHFYKVLFDPVAVEAIAFVLPNKALNARELPTFIVSVDEVEEKTELDFLSSLNDEVESLVESTVAESMW